MTDCNQTEGTRNCYDDQVDLRELVRIFWSGRWQIVQVTYVATGIAVIVALIFVQNGLSCRYIGITGGKPRMALGTTLGLILGGEIGVIVVLFGDSPAPRRK